MRVGVSTLTVDASGAFIMEAEDSDSDAATFARRVISIKTLDGGASVIDSGYTNFDRIIELVLKEDLTESEVRRLRNLFQAYSSVLLFLPDGAFKASPERFSYARGTASARFLITGWGEVTYT
jgi:hypothetical protein